MSPQTGEMLVNEVVPRLRVLIPHSVSQVGHEDYEELVQDSTVMAVKMLNSAERRGKKVSAGNIAYYTVLHARSGRRSYAAGSPDVLHPKNRMKLGEPESFDVAVKEDECGGDPLLLADVFSNSHEVAEEFQNYVEVQRAVGSFLEPPVPGTEDIVPLTDAGQLLEEGRAQRNCVGGYASRVAGGKVFVYRVLKPERATLSLRLGADGGWEIEQLLRACNQPVSPATTIAVLRWLARESVSI